MAKIYIAGPMSGLPNFNRDAFNLEAERLHALGHIALNPAILPDGLEQHEYMAIKLGKPVILTSILHEEAA